MEFLFLKEQYTFNYTWGENSQIFTHVNFGGILMNDINVITICGSMRFTNEMVKISEELELKQGYAVIQCVYSADG